MKEEIARAIASPSVSDYVSLIRLAIVGTFSIPAKRTLLKLIDLTSLHFPTILFAK